MKSEMKRWKFFLVWTCIKPNLVFSEISEMKRWTDEENVFWVQTCIKPNLVLSEISEMRWRVRWRDEENFFWSKHVSSQIWCYLKLVRWRDEEWDEEMNNQAKIFWVRTCIKPNLVSKIFPFIGPNLVLSEISEIKRWRVRWTDENFFLVWTCIKPNLVLSEISEMKRWRVRWRDEHIKKNFLGLNMYQAKSGVIWN